MRRLAIGALALALLLPLGVNAVEGPETDPNNRDFNITIRTDRDPVTNAPLIDTTQFDTTLSPQASRDGWDFGDRVGYACGYVEWFNDGAQEFSVHYELIKPYPVENVTPQINDHLGAEDQGTAMCGSNLSNQPNEMGATFDGTDHFPHSGSLVFYKDLNGDGFVFASAEDELARIDYPNTCGQLYWTPGDEAGEMWLWTDVDGASDRDMHGDGLCGGGSEEPYAATRVHVMEAVTGIGYCTESAEGQNCAGIDDPITPVTLDPGISELTCSDESTPVVEQSDPLRVSCP